MASLKPALVANGADLDAFWKDGSDDTMRHAAYVSSAWGSPQSLGAPGTSCTTPSAWESSGRIGVVSQCGGSVYFDCYDGAWTGWLDLGGSAQLSPAVVVWDRGELNGLNVEVVAVRSSDSAIEETQYSSSTSESCPTSASSFGSWNKRGGSAASGLKVVATDTTESFDIYYKH